MESESENISESIKNTGLDKKIIFGNSYFIEESEVSRKLKLNLGCGSEIYPGYVNIDKVALPGTDFVWDLEKTPLPFKDNSVFEIRAEHILEHIVNYLPLLEDIHRMCVPRANIEFVVPYYKYEGAFRDPTHVIFFTEHSFDYF